MRRNAESLLVVVGESSPRRWAKPLAITDVVRAGISEVEDYRRVSLRHVDDVYVTGAAVSELAHLLAELIENALSFSSPDLQVEIYGRRVGVRYMLAVVDHGVGMPLEQLAQANARLRGEEDFIVAPTRFLGHYVVGRLARRLGVEVELILSAVSGIVARLLLPESMVADPPVPRPENGDEQAGEIRCSATEAGIPVGNGSTTGTATLSRPRQERLVTGPALTQITHNSLVKRNPKRLNGKSGTAPVRQAPGSPVVETRSPEEIRSMLTKFRSAHQHGTVDNTENMADKEESQ
jgi:anti-sigma regulatory factor (Ser/Thr protein kinase)